MFAGNKAAYTNENCDMPVAGMLTFPGIFMKFINTFNDAGVAISLPAISPKFIDYGFELRVLMGR